MKTRMSLWIAAGLGSAAIMAPVAAWCGEDIDRTIPLEAEGLVRVENLAGQIEFIGWDRPEVQLRGELGDSVEELVVDTSSAGVTIRVRNRKGKRNVDATDLFLRLPQSASIEADSVSADISVSENNGQSVLLNTVSGDLEIEASPQKMELHSVSGDIEFDGSSSRSTVETVSGEITLVGPSGEVSVNTVSGDVTLEADEVNRGRFESVSGDMTLSLALGDGGRLSCDSMSGDVKLRLPESQQAEFTAQSYSGNINSEFGKSDKVSRGPGEMLRHRVGDNGAQIRLETFSGDVHIRSR